MAGLVGVGLKVCTCVWVGCVFAFNLSPNFHLSLPITLLTWSQLFTHPLCIRAVHELNSTWLVTLEGSIVTDGSGGLVYTDFYYFTHTPAY